MKLGKSFTSAIHVMTEDEAKFLVEKLNELQEKCGEISDYHDLYSGGSYTYSQPEDITDYHDSQANGVYKFLEKNCGEINAGGSCKCTSGDTH